MKKLLLLLLCVPLIGFTQSNTVVHIIEFSDDESNFWVIDFPNQQKLLKKERNKYKDSILHEESPSWVTYDYTLRKDLSKEYFNVDKILEVYIYNDKSDILGIAKYVKTVCVEEEMVVPPTYYHIFKISDITSINPSVSFIKEDLKSNPTNYFISNSLPKNNNIVIKEYNNTDLDNIIRKFIGENNEYDMSHYELQDGKHKTIYSRINICNYEGNYFKSYITETIDGEINTLLTRDYCLFGAYPTKVFINNKPVFVGSSGIMHEYPSRWIIK